MNSIGGRDLLYRIRKLSSFCLFPMWDDFNLNILTLEVIHLCLALSHAAYVTAKP